jgi:hypothetical protein
MFKKAGVSFDPLALKLLNKLLKGKNKTGERTNRSAYLCRLVVEEAKRTGLFKGE